MILDYFLLYIFKFLKNYKRVKKLGDCIKKKFIIKSAGAKVNFKKAKGKIIKNRNRILLKEIYKII